MHHGPTAVFKYEFMVQAWLFQPSSFIILLYIREFNAALLDWLHKQRRQPAILVRLIYGITTCHNSVHRLSSCPRVQLYDYVPCMIQEPNVV